MENNTKTAAQISEALKAEKHLLVMQYLGLLEEAKRLRKERNFKAAAKAALSAEFCIAEASGIRKALAAFALVNCSFCSPEGEGEARSMYSDFNSPALDLH